MSFFAGAKSQASQQAAVSGLQLQSSAYGKVIPIVYGTTRIAPNLIWYGDFVATPQQSSGGGAGKGGGGGGGKSGSSGSYVYQTAVALGLCEGPIAGVGNVYLDKTVTSLSALGLSFFSGAYGQAPWGYLLSQAAPVSEAYTIPAAAPYSITVAQASDFLLDDGVTKNASGSYSRVDSSPGALQYTVQLFEDTSLYYTFNAANAGAVVGITYQVDYQTLDTVYATIPSAAPYNVIVTAGSSTLSDEGVVGTSSVFSATTGTPTANQYTVLDGVYNYAAANAGAAITIMYYTASGNPALGYSGTAYAAASAYQLGTSAQLPNHNMEVIGNSSFTSTTNGLDADPSLLIADLLTNAHYGCGFPSARLGNLSVYQAYCLANGLWISPAYTDQAQASSMLDDIATATNSAFVWSQGLLSLVPYGDENISGNGYSYTPPSAPLYNLTDDDFLPNSNVTGSSATVTDDPVLLTRMRPSDAMNDIKIEVLDRTNYYNTAVIEAKDQALIQAFGLRTASSSQMHMFCDLNAAQLSAQLQLQRQAIRNTYQFTLDQRYVLLDPMDIVTLTDANLGLNQQWVRITEITENDDASLSISAEEYLAGTGSASLYSFQQGIGFSGNYNVAPGNVNMPVIFEPTAALAENLEVWLAISGGPLWGGCDVYISNDGTSYRNVGTVTGSARTGLLTSTLSSVVPSATGVTIDAINTLAVNCQQSDAQLLSASQNDALSLATLCYVDGEYIAYENALLSGANSYDLSWLVRGAYGTVPKMHPVGAQFARLDNSIFSFSYTQDFIGTTVYIKLVSFNIYGGGRQLISEVQPYAYTLTGVAYSSPLPDVTNLGSSYLANITQLSWTEITDFRAVLYEIRKGAAWIGAQMLARVAHSPFPVQGNGTYWVGVYSQPLPALQIYSPNPPDIIIAGAQITSNVIASYDEAATGWLGSTSGDAFVTGSIVRTGGAGNILTILNFLGTPDILNYGGVGSGIYQIPSSHVINIGRVAPCSIIISWMSVGQHITDNILSVIDYLNFPDLLDYAASANTNIYPEIALSQDGVTWGAWQKYVAGSYSAMAFRARMQIKTFDPTVEAILQDFVFEVDVPDRDDHYVNLSIPSGGKNLTFVPDGSTTATPFNGGPAGSPTMPQIQVTVLAAQAGDIVSITSVTLSGCTIQILNSGVGVARNVNVLVQGY